MRRQSAAAQGHDKLASWNDAELRVRVLHTWLPLAGLVPPRPASAAVRPPANAKAGLLKLHQLQNIPEQSGTTKQVPKARACVEESGAHLRVLIKRCRLDLSRDPR